MANNRIKIPEKHYLTFSAGRGSEALLAFMTPYGTDSAAKKRMATADGWAGNSWGRQPKIQIDAKTVDNELLSGFSISKEVQRDSTSNVVWRILDPRGFELEISSGNMANLIQLTTIENGEILTRCIWAREGANNILLSENDEFYKEARSNTGRMNKKVSMKDVEIGNEVLMHSGTKAIYMGKFYSIHLSDELYQDDNGGYIPRQSYSYSQRSSATTVNEIEISKSSKHYFLIKGSLEGWNKGDRYMSVASPKISEILSQNKLTISETEKMINDGFTSGTQSVVDGRGDTEYRFMGVVSSKIEVEQFKAQIVEIDDIKATLKIRKDNSKKANIYREGQALIGHHENNWLIVSSSIFYEKHNKDLTGSIISLDEFKDSRRLKRSSSTKYSRYARPTTSKRVTLSPYPQWPDATWFLPTVVVNNPSTSNKFEMILPTC